ncbi:hypothetical protein NM208_g4392 [Fusarium decemcellulare]|uniref:Uncharacterized protein n=1 Tax=Fusarium decemcellulare TaxID=57161 RepID=A0ACC1SL01_9HYPO|nr:hypothetical protein NM208_g4392 [Fusarium decemcellulare]
MSYPPNKAIYLDAQGKHTVRIIEEPYVPKGAQSLVEVQYSAINPADTRHYYMGMSEYVAGYEFVGTVRATGPDSPFKPGQEVFGFSLPADHRPKYLGAHQDFLLAEPQLLFERPPSLNLDPINAVTMLAGALTSIDGLFNTLGYGFPTAKLDGDDPKDVPILIWGGASVVGQAAIKLARAAGFSPILTTASPHNHDALRKLGATHCFNYMSSTVVDDIHTTMRELGKKLKTVFDSVSSGLGIFEGLSKEEEQAIQEKYDQSTAAIARRCCDTDIAESELRLSAVLPVAQDPTWKFCLMFRTVETMDHGVGDLEMSPKEREAEETKIRRWGARNDHVIRWLIANHEKYWEAPRTRTVETAEEGIQAIKDVWSGKTSREKIVIKHPM